MTEAELRNCVIILPDGEVVECDKFVPMYDVKVHPSLLDMKVETMTWMEEGEYRRMREELKRTKSALGCWVMVAALFLTALIATLVFK
jgi:hypothetical protein